MIRPGKLLGLRVAVVLLSLGLTLLVAELALRIAGFSFHLYPERVEFGWPDPVSLERHFDEDPDVFWLPRGYFDDLERAIAERPAIVFMGDSCTQFGEYDEALASLVQQRLAGRQLRYSTLGVIGWSSFQGLQQLRRDVLRIRPAVITIYYGWNDHWVGYGIEDKDVLRIKGSPLANLRGLRVVQLIDRARVGAAHRRDGLVDQRVPLEDFRHNLREIIAVARRNDIVPVLLTAPDALVPGREPDDITTRWLREKVDLLPLHDSYVEAVREVAEQQQAGLIDLAARFDELPPTTVRRDYFMTDGIHLRPAGDEKIAQFLYEGLERLGLLDKVVEPELPRPRPVQSRRSP